MKDGESKIDLHSSVIGIIMIWEDKLWKAPILDPGTRHPGTPHPETGR